MRANLQYECSATLFFKGIQLGVHPNANAKIYIQGIPTIMLTYAFLVTLGVNLEDLRA